MVLQKKSFKERKEASTVLNVVEGTSQIKTEIGPLEFTRRKVFEDHETFIVVQVKEEA